MKLDRPTLQQLADWLAIAVVVSLPWSTSATLALIVLWLIAVLPALDVASIRRELSTAAGGLPVLLWVLAAIGMLWADVSFADRIDGLGGFHRLLAIPVLLAQFRRSDYGRRACSAFLISAIVMLALSWILALMPKAAAASVPVFGRHFALYGVPAKDYIFQSSVFLICAMALIAAACERWRGWGWRNLVILLGLAGCFLANIAFVATARTTVLVAPLLAIVLGHRLFGCRGVVVGGILAAALIAAAVFVSPYLYLRVTYTLTELRGYLNADAATSAGLHLDFLRRSAEIVATAPAFGHGTSQSNLRRRHPARHRRCRGVARHVGRAFSAVSRRGPAGVDRHFHRRREFHLVAGHLAFVRFRPGLALRVRRRHHRWNRATQRCAAS